MTRRVLFICIWTVAFFFGTALFLFIASGIYLAASTPPNSQPRDLTIFWIGTSWALVPMLLGLVGLALGVLGLLPGTQKKPVGGVPRMASSVLIVRQFAWISLVPQFALMAALMGAACLAGAEPFVVVGAVAYLAALICVRRFLARDQRSGIALFRQKMFANALPHFQRSYEFFSRHRWLDDWRFVTLLSSSRISYREMALLNIAYCHAQTGNGSKSREYYLRVAQEFPGSQIAEASLRMLEAAKGIAEAAAPNGGLGARAGISGVTEGPPSVS